MCLNPCFNGRCTRTAMNNFTVTGYVCKVLILVLMEDALVLYHSGVTVISNLLCLNPCFNGRCTRTGGLTAAAIGVG
mgnify:CR=1 FL=1